MGPDGQKAEGGGRRSGIIREESGEKQVQKMKKNIENKEGEGGEARGESMLAVSNYLRDKSSSYMICFAALLRKVSAPASQSDLLCVSPLLPQAGMVFLAKRPNEVPEQALCSKQWYKSAHNG